MSADPTAVLGPLQSLGLLLTADVPMVGSPRKPQAGVASAASNAVGSALS